MGHNSLNNPSNGAFNTGASTLLQVSTCRCLRAAVYMHIISQRALRVLCMKRQACAVPRHWFTALDSCGKFQPPPNARSANVSSMLTAVHCTRLFGG